MLQTNYLVIISILLLLMITLTIYVFFTSKTCGFKSINKLPRIMMMGGYLLFFLTILYSLIKSIIYGHITINYITITVLTLSVLLSLIGVIINIIKRRIN